MIRYFLTNSVRGTLVPDGPKGILLEITCHLKDAKERGFTAVSIEFSFWFSSDSQKTNRDMVLSAVAPYPQRPHEGARCWYDELGGEYFDTGDVSLHPRGDRKLNKRPCVTWKLERSREKQSDMTSSDVAFRFGFLFKFLDSEHQEVPELFYNTSITYTFHGQPERRPVERLGKSLAIPLAFDEVPGTSDTRDRIDVSNLARLIDSSNPEAPNPSPEYCYLGGLPNARTCLPSEGRWSYKWVENTTEVHNL